LKFLRKNLQSSGEPNNTAETHFGKEVGEISGIGLHVQRSITFKSDC